MKNPTQYKAPNDNEVYCGKAIVAKIYLKADATILLYIAKGMPRDETVLKLLSDCPDFCTRNGITEKTNPKLF